MVSTQEKFQWKAGNTTGKEKGVGGVHTPSHPNEDTLRMPLCTKHMHCILDVWKCIKITW